MSWWHGINDIEDGILIGMMGIGCLMLLYALLFPPKKRDYMAEGTRRFLQMLSSNKMLPSPGVGIRIEHTVMFPNKTGQPRATYLINVTLKGEQNEQSQNAARQFSHPQANPHHST